MCTDIINSKRRNYHKTNTPKHTHSAYLSTVCTVCAVAYTHLSMYTHNINRKLGNIMPINYLIRNEGSQRARYAKQKTVIWNLFDTIDRIRAHYSGGGLRIFIILIGVFQMHELSFDVCCLVCMINPLYPFVLSYKQVTLVKFLWTKKKIRSIWQLSLDCSNSATTIIRGTFTVCYYGFYMCSCVCASVRLWNLHAPRACMRAVCAVHVRVYGCE